MNRLKPREKTMVFLSGETAAQFGLVSSGLYLSFSTAVCVAKSYSIHHCAVPTPALAPWPPARPPCCCCCDASSAAAALAAATAAAPLVLGLRHAGDFLPRRGFHARVTRQRHAEPDLRVVLDEPDRGDRQVLGVVGRAQDARELRRHLGIVEERRLRLLDRIDNPPPAARRCFVVVPETIAELEPVRRHSGREDVLADLRRRPARGQIVVGFGQLTVGRGRGFDA